MQVLRLLLVGQELAAVLGVLVPETLNNRMSMVSQWSHEDKRQLAVLLEQVRLLHYKILWYLRAPAAGPLSLLVYNQHGYLGRRLCQNLLAGIGRSADTSDCTNNSAQMLHAMNIIGTLECTELVESLCTALDSLLQCSFGQLHGASIRLTRPFAARLPAGVSCDYGSMRPAGCKGKSYMGGSSSRVNNNLQGFYLPAVDACLRGSSSQEPLQQHTQA